MPPTTAGAGWVEDAAGIQAKEDSVHPISQRAFDLDVVLEPPPPVIDRPPEDLPDQDREAAVRKLASLIAKHHVAGGRPMTMNSFEVSPKVLTTHRHR